MIKFNKNKNIRVLYVNLTLLLGSLMMIALMIVALFTDGVLAGSLFFMFWFAGLMYIVGIMLAFSEIHSGRRNILKRY